MAALDHRYRTSRTDRAGQGNQDAARCAGEAVPGSPDDHRPGNLFGALSSFGFTDLESLARRDIEAIEAAARLEGVAMVDYIEAEVLCIKTLRGMKITDQRGDFDKGAVAARFNAQPYPLQNTLADCLQELDYWHQLYLRHAVDIYASDGPGQFVACHRRAL